MTHINDYLSTIEEQQKKLADLLGEIKQTKAGLKEEYTGKYFRYGLNCLENKYILVKHLWMMPSDHEQGIFRADGLVLTISNNPESVSIAEFSDIMNMLLLGEEMTQEEILNETANSYKAIVQKFFPDMSIASNTKADNIE